MIECRYCREIFRKPPEKIGARCPTCRMPLFEKERQRTPVVDLGPCSVHKENQALGKCQRCGRMMCAACRTRWEDEIVCPACLEKALQAGEASPRQVRALGRQATWSFLFALAAWGLLALSLWPISSLGRGQPSKELAYIAATLFLGAWVPAAAAVGHGVSSLCTRARNMALAVVGVCLAGLQLGISIGLLVLNIWAT